MVGLDGSLNLWTFEGIVFERADYTDGDPLWLPREAILSKEPMMGGGANRDTAGYYETTISITARFLSVAIRASMYTKVGVTGHLSKKSGESGYFTLSNCEYTWLVGGLPAAKLTFQ